MRRMIPTSVLLLLLAFAGSVHAQRWRDEGRRTRVPDIDGTWFMNGNEDAPAQIVQPRRDGRALFINENGSRAWGTVRGDRVWIPDWTDGRGSDGLEGKIRGDRIVWPDGSYWSR